MHDDCIVAYNVNLQEKYIVIQTYNSDKKKRSKHKFSEVLTHSFKCIVNSNIIYDIQESEIGAFISENKDELIKMKGYCWPVDYKSEKDLIEFLNSNAYKYIKIYSSYGMYGWILAKSYEIETE